MFMTNFAFSLVDVNREILSQRTWDRPLDELISQAHLAGNLMDRLDALEALDYAQFTDELELYDLFKTAKTRLEKRFIVSRFRRIAEGFLFGCT